MKKIVSSIILLLSFISAPAQTYIWKNGEVIFELRNEMIDSITFRDPLENFRFSVAENKQVYFSPGNLQYYDVDYEWRFASKQYEVLGYQNINRLYDENDYVIRGIDLFGWGTSGWGTDWELGLEPTMTSTDSRDYYVCDDWRNGLVGKYSCYDWGVENEIVGYGKGWRTLSSDEWNYLISVRPSATSLFALATVVGQKGLIILPDNWKQPSGISFTPSVNSGMTYQTGFYIDESFSKNHFEDNIYDAAQWKAMERKGAVFLPAAGRRYGDRSIENYGTSSNDWGIYWSTTAGAEEREGNVCGLAFHPSQVVPMQETKRAYGCSVRLVKDF
ncbi:MAG: hypothetical protein MJZ01_02780 [Bacteroidales bacterium]|nr:hypothetical protein [Bacteroidales bacterium]